MCGRWGDAGRSPDQRLPVWDMAKSVDPVLPPGCRSHLPKSYAIACSAIRGGAGASSRSRRAWSGRQPHRARVHGRGRRAATGHRFAALVRPLGHAGPAVAGVDCDRPVGVPFASESQAAAPATAPAQQVLQTEPATKAEPAQEQVPPVPEPQTAPTQEQVRRPKAQSRHPPRPALRPPLRRSLSGKLRVRPFPARSLSRFCRTCCPRRARASRGP